MFFINHYFSKIFKNENDDVSPNDRRMIKHHFFIAKDQIPYIVKAIEDEFQFEVETNDGLRDNRLELITELSFGFDKEGNVIKIFPLYCGSTSDGWKKNWSHPFRTFKAIAPDMCRTENSSRLQFQNRMGAFETWCWVNDEFVLAL